MFRFALAQINTTVGDLEGNRNKILLSLGQARSAQADIVLFPELAVCGYPPEDLLLKQHFLKDNLQSLKLIVKEVQDIIAVVGFVDQDRKGRLFNAAAIVAGGKIRAVYHKHALPNYGVFDEKRYFVEGVNDPLLSIGGVKMAVNICEDIWLKDGIHLSQTRAGAKVLMNISSSPYDFSKCQARRKLLCARARETGAFICYVNLVGGQDELVFDGDSLVVDPRGKIMATGSSFAEDLLLVDLPVKVPAKPASARGCVVIPTRGLVPAKKPLPSRSAEEIDTTKSIYQALVLGTRDYVRKNDFEKVVIGLSGGVDSSLVAAVAVDAVGSDNVIGVTMPSKFTSAETRRDADQVARNLKIRLLDIPITRIHDSYLGELRDSFAGTASGVAEENIQARIRGNILMALSNKFGWLVLTTGNKSEIAVGYCTLYGDMSGGFAVIKDVPKTVVYDLSRFVNGRGRELIPQSVLRRAPTAELRENQKDEDSLPPYEVLDPLLKAYVEEHRSLTGVIKEDPALARKVMGLVDQSEYKRRQAPPGVKITSRAFGKDWRLPITNKYKKF